ncbi:MAG: response regulator transcription factor [Tissierella sp.]|uniref:response regulator transcription factor n=1 Tax=Tissierella sp. TaxID=41274 RepID=UPI003F9A26E1
MTNLLLVEDDTTLSLGIVYSLEKEGYKVDKVNTVESAKNIIDDKKFDLIILDIGLPDGDGFELCKYIRQNRTTPIIFLSAEDEEVNIVMALDMGGDDYITKPFRINELLSRIKAVLRRYNKTLLGQNLQSGDIKVDLLSNKVFVKDEEINLTASEYKLLLILMKNFKIALSRLQILENLWDTEGDFVDDNSLSVYIKRLREKIEEDFSQPKYIKTLRGVGYMWDMEVVS